MYSKFEEALSMSTLYVFIFDNTTGVLISCFVLRSINLNIMGLLRFHLTIGTFIWLQTELTISFL